MKISILISIVLFGFFFNGCKTPDTNHDQKVNNLILIIGNALMVSEIQNELLSNPKQFNLSRTSNYGFSKPWKNDSTKNAKGDYTTVLSIGKKGSSESIGLDSEGVAQPNLIELASVKGMVTGLITSGSAVDAIPATFTVHVTDGNNPETIASEYLNSPFNLFIGNGIQHFVNRSDNRNLLQQLKNKGYSFSFDIENKKLSNKLIVFEDEQDRISTQVIKDQSLSKSTLMAIQFLSSEKNGFLLIIDHSLNELVLSTPKSNGVKKDNYELDQTIGKVFDFADKNPGTLVIVVTESEINKLTNWNQKSKPIHGSEVVLPVFSYGTLSSEFEGEFERSAIFNKIISLLNLASQ